MNEKELILEIAKNVKKIYASTYQGGINYCLEKGLDCDFIDYDEVENFKDLIEKVLDDSQKLQQLMGVENEKVPAKPKSQKAKVASVKDFIVAFEKCMQYGWTFLPIIPESARTGLSDNLINRLEEVDFLTCETLQAWEILVQDKADSYNWDTTPITDCIKNNQSGGWWDTYHKQQLGEYEKEYWTNQQINEQREMLKETIPVLVKHGYLVE